MIKTEKLYYLAHPLTTGGRTMAQNRVEEKLVYYQIMSQYPHAKILRPLALLPDGMDDETAMSKCYNLLRAADAIILSPGWELSTGCFLEYEFSRGRDQEILLFKDNAIRKAAQTIDAQSDGNKQTASR